VPDIFTKAKRRALTARIAEIFRREQIESWAGCFVILSELKLRVLPDKVGVPDIFAQAERSAVTSPTMPRDGEVVAAW